MTTLNRNKYKQAILYFCQKLGGEVRGKKKLAKLLYYLDFDFFEKYQKNIIGDSYKALPMGPFPVTLEKTTQDMEAEKILSIKPVTEREGYNATEVYTCLTEPDESVFSLEEKEMLDRVLKKYGQLNGRQLEELTHAEAP